MQVTRATSEGSDAYEEGRQRVVSTGLRHIGIIMDGNGRWATRRSLPRLEGHHAGYEAVDRTVSTARRMGIEALTLYTFSTENWSRPDDEVDGLFELLVMSAREQHARLVANGIRFDTIGRTERLPELLKHTISWLKAETAHNSDMVLTLAIDYGGRDEMVRTMQDIARDIEAGQLRASDVNEALISQRLDTGGLMDPDLIIRTAGELRLSNFLLWQAAYSELYISPVEWPDFDTHVLLDALRDYAQRDRRYGGLTTSGRADDRSCDA